MLDGREVETNNYTGIWFKIDKNWSIGITSFFHVRASLLGRRKKTEKERILLLCFYKIAFRFSKSK